MTPHEKWLAAGFGVLLILVAIGAYELLQEHDARIRAEITTAAQKPNIQQGQAEVKQGQVDEAKAISDLKTEIARLEGQRTVVITPQQAAQQIPQVIPNLPAPVKVEPTPTAADPKAQSIVIPQEDLQALQNYRINCDENSARLAACTLGQEALKTQLEGTTGELTATAKQRDMWEATAKGGTFWHRFVGGAKKVGIGLVIGGAIGYAASR
jgi:hypothetical protein